MNWTPVPEAMHAKQSGLFIGCFQRSGKKKGYFSSLSVSSSLTASRRKCLLRTSYLSIHKERKSEEERFPWAYR
jgi:hypothetical protein